MGSHQRQVAFFPSCVINCMHDKFLSIWRLWHADCMWVVCRKNVSIEIFIHCHMKNAPPILLVWHWPYNIICKDCRLQFLVRVIPKEDLAKFLPPILLLVWQQQILRDTASDIIIIIHKKNEENKLNIFVNDVLFVVRQNHQISVI